jgi:hypothetical protein
MSFKADQYYKGGGEDAKDNMANLNARLAADLRVSVRKLGNFPLFTPPWMEMVETLARMATVTEMESNLPQAKENATLWETEEQAVRFISEDGKLNVLLNSMIEYKTYMRNVYNSKTKDELDLIHYKNECKTYEIGLGIVLKSCWLHVEGIQTTDITGFICYISDLLSYALGDGLEQLDQIHAKAINNDNDTGTGRSDVYQRQECMLYTYINLFISQIETIGESRIMPCIRSNKIFIPMIQFLIIAESKKFITDSIVCNTLEMLSIFVSTRVGLG